MRELLSPLAERVFTASPVVFFETDLDGAPDLSVIALPNGAKLSDVLPADLYGRVQAQWVGLGLPNDRLTDLRPNFAAMNLNFSKAAQAGYTPQLGVDRILWERTKEERKARGHMETLSSQLRMLADTPIEEQVTSLEHILSQADLGVAELVDIVTAWRAGDLDFFERFVVKIFQRTPKTLEVVISVRNRDWIPDIVRLAKSSTPCLIVVGVLHLFGKTGLPVLLQEHGLQAEFQRDP